MDFPAEIAALLEGFFREPGHTDPALRRALADRAAALSLGAPPPEVAPADLADYADAVAARASAITDDDVAALLAAGHSEDVIFEVTLAAATGAAEVRLARGLAALRGEE